MTDTERFDRAVERLLSDQSPREDAEKLTAEEQKMLRMAQLLRGHNPPPPRPHFVEELRHRLIGQPRRVSRRAAFLSGLGAMAAGLLAGLGIDRATRGGSSPKPAGPTGAAIVDTGTWYHVANVAELPAGAVRSFTAGSVQGFLINREGSYHALSRICTHMGCVLQYERSDGGLLCPCHGAEFDLSGRMTTGPGGYGEGTGLSLRPLPRVQVRVRGEKIEVLGA